MTINNPKYNNNPKSTFSSLKFLIPSEKKVLSHLQGFPFDNEQPSESSFLISMAGI